jgi:deoxyribose-phosphate aldolase
MSDFKQKKDASPDENRANLDELVETLTQEVMRRISPAGTQNAKPVSIEITQPSQVARYIDHTLLKPDATADQIKVLCEEARKYNFATVCVNSSQVRLAAELLKGSPVMAIAVVGFPLGASTAKAKAFETLEAIRNGAQEIDTVINIGALKGKDYKTVLDDIKAVVDAAQPIPVKVILETSQLNDEEKVIACALASGAGAAFVKTSTGFSGGGATVEDIKLMRRVVGPLL